MPLTRSFKETVQLRVQQDPAFAAALLAESVDAFLGGDVETGTGPEGGGDSKADTETTPVAEELTKMWFSYLAGQPVSDDLRAHPAHRLDELLPWNWKGATARLAA